MTIQDIVQGFIVPGITSVGVVWFLREWISARVRKGIQHEYDQKLETHKAQLKTESDKYILELQNEIEKQSALYETAIASFSESQRSTMERKLNSVEKLWAGVLILRDVIPPAFSLIDFMHDDDENKIETFQGIKKLLWNVEDYNKKTDSIDFVSIEMGRPYLGEYLWAIFLSYQMLHDHMYLKITATDNMDTTKFVNITEKVINIVTKSALTDDEFIEFDKLDAGKFFWLKKKLESKILDASRKIISGEEFGSESLKQAEAILEQIAKVKFSEDQLQKKT